MIHTDYQMHAHVHMYNNVAIEIAYISIPLRVQRHTLQCTLGPRVPLIKQPVLYVQHTAKRLYKSAVLSNQCCTPCMLPNSYIHTCAHAHT